MIYEYDGDLFPEYLKHGNVMQFFSPFAKQFCRGIGVDIGCGEWPFEDAEPIDVKFGGDAMQIPARELDYVVSSHCLEHLTNPVAALECWRDHLKPGGVLALYLPHPDMTYWRPSRCRKHLHSWAPADMAAIVRDLGFVNVIHSERDLAWSFAVVGWKPAQAHPVGVRGRLQCAYPGCTRLAGGGSGTFGMGSNYCKEHQP